MKIIWQEEETANGPFPEELAGYETESDYDPAMEEGDEEEQEQPSAGKGFGW